MDNARMLKRIVRAAGWLLGGFVALIVLWLVANRTLDTSLSPEAKELLKVTPRIPDDRNVAVGILGLTAPSGAKFMEQGIELKALYERDAPYDEVQRALDKGTLRPTVKGAQLNCWLDPDGPTFPECLPFKQAPKVLQENKELLERYKALYALDDYAATSVYPGDAFLILARLAITEVQLDLRSGRRDTAYRKWAEHLRFVKRNLRGQDTLVGKAVGLVALGIATAPLEYFFVAAPDLVQKHGTELDQDLRFGGMEGLDPDGIVRAELRLLAHAVAQPPRETPWGFDRLHWLAFHLGQRNRMLNRYAAFAPEYSVLLRKTGEDRQADAERLRRKHVEDVGFESLLDPFGTLLVEEFISSQLRIKELTRQPLFTEQRLRLARLATHLISKRVPDSQIADFLSASGPEFLDPFSQTPAHWDSRDRKIYFVDPTDKCWMSTAYRLPNKNSAPKPRSTLNMNACRP
jgi:hypothetical protein